MNLKQDAFLDLCVEFSNPTIPKFYLLKRCMVRITDFACIYCLFLFVVGQKRYTQITFEQGWSLKGHIKNVIYCSLSKNRALRTRIHNGPHEKTTVAQKCLWIESKLNWSTSCSSRAYFFHSKRKANILLQ